MTMFFTNYTKDESDELTFQIAQRFATYSRNEDLIRLVGEKDVAGLVAYPIVYSDGDDPIRVYASRQCLALFTKRDDIDIGIDTEQVALDKFIEAEAACKSTNARLTQPGWELEKSNAFISAVFLLAEEKIASVLGEVPSISDLHLVFGPGASTTCKRNTTARWKLSTKPACSADMLSIVGDVLDEVPHYAALHNDDDGTDANPFYLVTVEVVEGRLMFVLKNAKTKRSIIVEPNLNTLVQKGYGKEIKSLLLAAGVNLYDQTLNQRRARIGSLNGELCTVDLVSASDTNATELVRRLTPSDWFWALNRARTSRIIMPDGSVVKLEKFSSMGNAFTFELESLIFWALTWATCVASGIKPDVSVYGDDIICPAAAYARLQEVFSFCGFTINTAKSFSDGPFRESCGADYFKGINVRPFYQSTTWCDGTLCAFHNFIVRGDLQYEFPEVLELILGKMSAENLLYGPDGYGDGHLLVTERYTPATLTADPYSIRKPYKRECGWSGHVFDTFIKLPRRFTAPCPGDRILPAYSIYVGDVTWNDGTKTSVYEQRANRYRKDEGAKALKYMRISEPQDRFAVSGVRGAKRISIYTLGR